MEGICETGPTVYSPYPRRHESLTICWCNYKGSTFYSVILRPWVMVRPESNSRPPAWQTDAHLTEPPVRGFSSWVHCRWRETSWKIGSMTNCFNAETCVLILVISVYLILNWINWIPNNRTGLCSPTIDYLFSKKSILLLIRARYRDIIDEKGVLSNSVWRKLTGAYKKAYN